MKMITAIIKPFRLDDVRDALQEVGVTGLTVEEVKGYGRQQGHSELYRGAEYLVEFQPKLKIQVVVKAGLVDDALTAVLEAANTGKIGDGKLFVADIGEVVRVRTGERGQEAI